MLWFLLCLLLCAIIVAALDTDDEAAAAPPGIGVLPSECFNLTILRQGDHQLDVAPATPNHQWFAGLFTDLPTDAEVTIRLHMAGNDIGSNIADCRKWVGLRPLMTYADPARADACEWFRRDETGRWVSGDLGKRGAARFAGCGPVPEQSAVPVELAAECLSADGQTWSPWRELPEGVVDVEARTFTVRARFARPRAAVAIHVPFTVGYQDALLQRLRDGRFPGVSVDVVGASVEGRPLAIVRLDDPEHPTPLRLNEMVERPDGTTYPLVRIDDPPGGAKPRVLFINAREHGSEHPPSWVLQGLLRRLLEDTPQARRLRANTTWLLQFIYDPDGAAHSVFHAITDRFFPHDNHPVYGSVTPPEVVAYARYLRAFVNSGRLLAAVTTFYGLECNEGQPVLCPFAIRQERDFILAFNDYWFTRLRKLGVPTNDPRSPWHTGWVPYRLHGWCWYWYGPMTFAFQVGDRHPDHRMGLPELEAIGAHYAETLVDFLETPLAQARLEDTRRRLQERQKERELWFRTSMAGTPDDPTLYDMLSMGY